MDSSLTLQARRDSCSSSCTSCTGNSNGHFKLSLMAHVPITLVAISGMDDAPATITIRSRAAKGGSGQPM